MTALTEFFCNYCNASAQRREEGDELTTGYERVAAGTTPLGWWEVPGVGPLDVGHACPECVTEKEDVRQDIAARRGAETKRILGEDDDAQPTGGWPARTSPFGGEGG